MYMSIHEVRQIVTGQDFIKTQHFAVVGGRWRSAEMLANWPQELEAFDDP